MIATGVTLILLAILIAALQPWRRSEPITTGEAAAIIVGFCGVCSFAAGFVMLLWKYLP